MDILSLEGEVLLLIGVCSAFRVKKIAKKCFRIQLVI